MSIERTLSKKRKKSYISQNHNDINHNTYSSRRAAVIPEKEKNTILVMLIFKVGWVEM